jgi:methylmalonyl-CoA mutase
VTRTKQFKREHAKDAKLALARLQTAALSDTENVFEELLRTVEVATIGQITGALWEVWGRFRPSM